MGGCSIGGFKRRRPPLSADEYFRRRLGRSAARGRRIRLGFDLPGRRAQRADRAAGDPVSVSDRALRVAHRFRRRRPPSRRARRRADLSGAARPASPTSIASAPRTRPGVSAAASPAPSTRRCSFARDGSERKLKKATGVTMEAGDRLIFSTAGGGGWGDPRRRERRAVAGRRARRLRVARSSAGATTAICARERGGTRRGVGDKNARGGTPQAPC